MAACQRLSPSPSRVCLSTKNYANVEAAGFRLLRTTNEGFFFSFARREKLVPNIFVSLIFLMLSFSFLLYLYIYDFLR